MCVTVWVLCVTSVHTAQHAGCKVLEFADVCRKLSSSRINCGDLLWGVDPVVIARSLSVFRFNAVPLLVPSHTAVNLLRTDFFNRTVCLYVFVCFSSSVIVSNRLQSFVRFSRVRFSSKSSQFTLFTCVSPCCAF